MTISIAIIISLAIIGLTIVGVFTTFAVSQISQKRTESACELKKLDYHSEVQKMYIANIPIKRPEIRTIEIPENSFEAYEAGYKAGAKDMQHEAIYALLGRW